MDAETTSGKSSLRNAKPASEARRIEKLDDKAKTGFDGGNEAKTKEQAELEKKASLNIFLHSRI